MTAIVLNTLNLKYLEIDPIFAYLLILVLEIAFQENKNTKGLKIFHHTFLYTACADDTILKDKESLIEVMKIFDIFHLSLV